MTTKQPIWKMVANLGDVNPLQYGGYFVYTDTTGVYEAEGEYVIVENKEDIKDNPTDTPYTVWRYSLEKCTLIDGILSDNKYHPRHPAWFATPESHRKDRDRPQNANYLSNVSNCMDIDLKELQGLFCSSNIVERAIAYRLVGEYHGFDNLDSYPLRLTREESEDRYKDKAWRNIPPYKIGV